MALAIAVMQPHPASGAGGQPSPPLLLRGQTFDGTVAAGTTAVYRVSAAAGEYVRVAVDRAPSLVIEITSPAATPVAELFRVEFLYPTERVAWIADTAGNYLVGIRRRTEWSSGEYAVRLDEQRQALPDDERRVEAARTRERGERLRRAERADASRRALALFERALAISQSIADRAGEAEAWLAIGLTCLRLSDNARAVTAFEASLDAGGAAGNWPGDARALNGLGQAHRVWGDVTRALDFYTRATYAAGLSGDRWTEVGALNSSARISSDTGDPQTALATHARAIAMSRESGDRGGEAFALNNIGNIHQALGDMQAALAAYGDALAIRQSLGSELGASSTMSNIGRVYLAEGEPEKARRYFEQSLEITRRVGRRDNEGRNLTSLGSTHLALGNRSRAVDLLKEAVSVCGAVGDTFCEAEALTRLAEAESAADRPGQAREHVARATHLMRTLKDLEGEARTRITKARIEAKQGNLALARAETEATLAIVEDLRTKVASPTLRASYLAASRDAYELRVDVLMRLHAAEPTAGHAALALHTSERARARSLLDMLAEMPGGIREGVAPALLDREQTIRRQINVAAARRATLLAQSPTEAQTDLVERELQDLVTRYRQVEADIRLESPRYASLTQPVPLTLAEIRQQVVDRDSVLLEYTLGHERSYVWVVTDTTMTAFVLPGKAAIEQAARRTYELMQRSHRPGQAAQARAAATELSQMVLGPVAQSLAAKRIVIVPDGALQFVPFAALPRPSSAAEPLILRHEVVLLPSASVVPALRALRQSRPPGDRTLAVFADPVLQPTDARLASSRDRRARPASVTPAPQPLSRDLARSIGETGVPRFERLRFTRDEARAIAALAEPSSSLIALDFEASRTTALKPDLGRYRYVHFATHALVNTRHPELSGIVLSLVGADGQAQDGFLRLHDIYNLRLGAELVVLSACQTALGRDVRGEGLIGLTRGFMYAGAPRVMATLWDVRDEQTSELMTRFYRGLLRDGLPPAAALRAAQVSMLNDAAWSAPVYWAGFVLQGEWR